MKYLDTASGGDGLDRWLRTALTAADAVWIRTGFLSEHAVRELRPLLRQFLDADKALLIVAGGAPDQADLTALAELADLIDPYPSAELRVVVGSDEFQNAKIYAARFLDHQEAVVGSANLTRGGLTSNHEVIVVFDSRSGEQDDAIAEQVRSSVEAFRNRAGATTFTPETRLLLNATSRTRRNYRRMTSIAPTVALCDTLQPLMDAVDGTAGSARGLWDGAVRTGLIDLDNVIGGLSRGSLTVVAARPGSGSSTLVFDCARTASIADDRRTALFVLDQVTTDVTSHLLCAEAGIPRHRMRTGRMTDDEWTRLAQNMGRVVDGPLLLNCSAQAELSALVDEIRELHESDPLHLVVIDTLNMITLAGEEHPHDRDREVSVVARQLKRLALELEIPILVTAELGRGPEYRTDRRPQPVDLRDSDTVAQVADLMILIHRPDLHVWDDPRAGEVDLHIFHRYSPPAIITIGHELQFGRFTDINRS